MREEPAAQAIVLGDDCFEAAAAIGDYRAVGYCFSGHPMVGSGFESEHVAFPMESIDLPPSVAQEAAGPDHTADHLVEATCFIALGIDLMVGGEMHRHAGQLEAVPLFGCVPWQGRI